MLNSSFRPVASVQIPVSDGFSDMHGLYFFTSSEVSDGAGYLQDAAVGAGGELETLHGHAEHIEGIGIRLGKLMEHLFRHHGVAMDALEGLESFLLNLAGGDDALTDGGGGLTGLHLGELGEGDSLDLAMNIYASEDFRGR